MLPLICALVGHMEGTAAATATSADDPQCPLRPATATVPISGGACDSLSGQRRRQLRAVGPTSVDAFYFPIADCSSSRAIAGSILISYHSFSISTSRGDLSTSASLEKVRGRYPQNCF